MCNPIKRRQKMGESSAETADISAGAESITETRPLINVDRENANERKS